MEAHVRVVQVSRKLFTWLQVFPKFKVSLEVETLVTAEVNAATAQKQLVVGESRFSWEL